MTGRHSTRYPRASPGASALGTGPARSAGPKLGPILWQLPPTFRFDKEVIAGFLRLLPHDTRAAAALARRHDDHLKARAWLRSDTVRPIRHAIEIRHDSFCVPEFIALLRKHKVALVCADAATWPCLMDLTADFVYCRLHGSTELYRSGYDDTALCKWAARVRAWSSGKRMRDGTFADAVISNPAPRDAYIFFDNTDKLRAPHDAQVLMDKLGEIARPSAKRGTGSGLER